MALSVARQSPIVIGQPLHDICQPERSRRRVAPSNSRLCHKAVSQGPDLDEVGIVTLRLSLRRCGKGGLRTTGSHARLRRTQEPVEHAIATQPARLGVTKRTHQPLRSWWGTESIRIVYQSSQGLTIHLPLSINGPRNRFAISPTLR